MATKAECEAAESEARAKAPATEAPKARVTVKGAPTMAAPKQDVSVGALADRMGIFTAREDQECGVEPDGCVQTSDEAWVDADRLFTPRAILLNDKKFLVELPTWRETFDPFGVGDDVWPAPPGEVDRLFAHHFVGYDKTVTVYLMDQPEAVWPDEIRVLNTAVGTPRNRGAVVIDGATVDSKFVRIQATAKDARKRIRLARRGRTVGGKAGQGVGSGVTRRGVANRFAIQRGVNTWRVVFDGVELLGIGKNRGMFFVAYLAEHAGGEPMHALELEAKVCKFYLKDCGATVILDPEGHGEVTVGVDAVFQERDLNLDDARMAELVMQEERKAVATLESTSASMAAKTAALKTVEGARAFRRNRFGENSSPANDAAKRVRTAVDRTVDALRKMTYVSPEQGKALNSFSDYVEKHIRQASANLWPKTGLRQRNSGRQPGHFVCEKVPGIEWTVT